MILGNLQLNLSSQRGYGREIGLCGGCGGELPHSATVTGTFVQGKDLRGEDPPGFARMGHPFVA